MTNTVSQVDSSSPAKAPRKKRLVIIVAAVVLAIGLAIPAAIFGRQLLGFEEPAKDAAPGAAAPAGSQPGELTEFRDEQTGIALSYPSSWLQLKTNDPQIRLLASDGPQNSFLMRAIELPNPVGKQDLGSARQMTDQIVGANKTAKLLAEPQPIELGGLPGLWYVYSFQDTASGQNGAHSHFFLFKDKTMIALVFQTVPIEKFKESAPAFDKVTGSIHVLNQ